MLFFISLLGGLKPFELPILINLASIIVSSEQLYVIIVITYFLAVKSKFNLAINLWYLCLTKSGGLWKMVIIN